MESTAFPLPSLSQLFPEGIPRAPAREHGPAPAPPWTPVPQGTAARQCSASNDSAGMIPFRPAVPSDCPISSTEVPSPLTAVDSVFDTTASSRGSSVDYKAMSSPRCSSSSSIPAKRKAGSRMHQDKVHKRQSSKTVKEQKARREAQCTYQVKEALLDIMVHWTAARTQSQGNRKTSGLDHTKHDIDYAVIALLSQYLSRDLERAAFEGTEDEVRAEWDRIISMGATAAERRITDEPLRGSLLWFDELLHLPGDLCTCPKDLKDCRKHTMAVHKERTLQKIREEAARKQQGETCRSMG